MICFAWQLPRLHWIARRARRGHRSGGLALVLVAALLIPSLLHAEESEELRTRSQARVLLEAGYLFHLSGEYEQATAAYRESIRRHPTAEAHTFLGWSLSYLGQFVDAIEHCKKAIRLDPEFGNPYNDIGVYLMELGRYDEAVPWLRRAIASKRYCCYHYPHANLGEILMRKGRLAEARRSFERSLEYAPDYLPARNAMEYLGDQGETL